ncbi:MAG: hypothetical protein AB7J63_18800, partial [Vicinamibacterales bacterium]
MSVATLRDTGGRAPVADTGPARSPRPRVLVLSTSLLIHRTLRYTSFLVALAREFDVTVWSSSEPESDVPDGPADWQPFPPVRPFREFPYNVARRLNEFAWDATLEIPSRESIYRHTRRYPVAIRALRPVGQLIAALGLANALESRVERLLLLYPRSEEAARRLATTRPALVLTTGPFQFEQPAVVSAAKRLGVPVVALIPSWDNLSTKNRMVFGFDGYVVWSKGMRDELHAFYPQSREVPVHVTGAPQFDVFFQDRFRRSRQEFCASARLDPNRPFVVYAIGSPNFLKEHHGAIEMARRIERGDLGNVQLLVRPHPDIPVPGLEAAFREFGSSIVVQRTGEPDVVRSARRQDAAAILDWVNTFRHADVVVNLSSTVGIDAALCDRPVVNLDFDP